MLYKHLFFDLDHTLWDFETNARETLIDLYEIHQLKNRGVYDINFFISRYNFYNNLLWDKYAKGQIKQSDLKWKRMSQTLLEFKIVNKELAQCMSDTFLYILPSKKNLFPYTIEILEYLRSKNYILHLITNGFERVQNSKLESSNLTHYFSEIITSEKSNSVKPNKAIFDFAFSKTGALAKESIMIGDNLDADIQGGINAGIDTIFVNHLKIIPHIPSTYMVHHLKDLEQVFK